MEEILADKYFFEENVIIANTLIEQVILPEIKGCWFTKSRQGIKDSASEAVISAVSTDNSSTTGANEDMSTHSASSNNECTTYVTVMGWTMALK